MAPDADKLRQRNAPVSTRDPAETEKISTLKSLQSNEVAIDGVIYDLTSFDHPGGESIFIFGGNDATTQYKMIHPYHSSKHLEKMHRVGTVPDYHSEYKFDTEFEREIKSEVFKIVRRGKEFGTPGYFLRAICYISFFFYLQFLWVSQGTSYTLAILYGVSMGLIGLNVQHDANHGAASRRTWVNDLLGLGADFIGGCKWLWMEKHWTHHAFCNHTEKDPDGFSAEPFILFNNYPLGHPKRAAKHAYQAFYFVLVLCGYWHSAVFNLAEVYDVRDRGALNVGVKLDNPWIATRGNYALPLRILHLMTNVIVPLLLNPSWSTFMHINILGIAGSLTLGLLFTLSHNFEDADLDPTVQARKTGEPVCWFKAQVETSSTYGGMTAGWLTGGLNFQVEHHLFPRMSSAWYPYIAPTVRKVCKKHGVRYVYYPWLWQNMISTFKFTHALGNGLDWRSNPFKGEQ